MNNRGSSCWDVWHIDRHYYARFWKHPKHIYAASLRFSWQLHDKWFVRKCISSRQLGNYTCTGYPGWSQLRSSAKWQFWNGLIIPKLKTKNLDVQGTSAGMMDPLNCRYWRINVGEQELGIAARLTPDRHQNWQIQTGPGSKGAAQTLKILDSCNIFAFALTNKHFSRCRTGTEIRSKNCDNSTLSSRSGIERQCAWNCIKNQIKEQRRTN